MTLLLGIPSMHWNRTWAKLNAHHLGTWICWLLIDSCFRSFITVRWRHWCREKTVNSCCTFLSKPRRQTVVNQLSWGFNPHLCKLNFFFSFWNFLKQVFLLCCDGTYFGPLLWHLGHCLAQLALLASHQYWHVSWAWQRGKGLSWWLHLAISIQMNNCMEG